MEMPPCGGIICVHNRTHCACGQPQEKNPADVGSDGQDLLFGHCFWRAIPEKQYNAFLDEPRRPMLATLIYG
jgi:hypothetical protein